MAKAQSNNKRNDKGFSMVEAMLAVAVFALIASAFTSSLVYGPQGEVDAGLRNRANYLIEEAFSGLDTISSDAWNELEFNQSGLDTSANQWDFLGEGTDETIGDYTRTIAFADVCRTAANVITACPGTYTDPHTKQVTVTISWTGRYGNARSTDAVRYYTNWQGDDWVQTDWVGGSGQANWSDATKYDSDNSNVTTSTAGQVTLKQQVACGDHAYPFTTSTDYTYTGSLIEVTGGKAQLVSNGTAVDSNTKGLWHLDETSGSFVDYSGNNNTLTVTGTPTRDVTGQFGGDAVTFSSGSQNGSITDATQTGLDITGSITLEAWVKKTTLSGTDVIMEKWTSAGNRSYQLMNTATGAITFTLRNGASTATATTAAAAITTGTWYHLAAVYDGATMKIYVNGTQAASTAYAAGIQNGTAAFEISANSAAAFDGTIDEVRVSNTARYSANFSVATTPFGLYYSTTEPTIQPTTSYTPTNISAWIGLTETSTLGANTAINYQLSDDNGTTWKYWNGAAWAVAGSTNYNSATTITTNIASFSTTNGKLMFKAFLISDGSDQVQLDNVTLRCARDQAYPFTTSTDYTYTSSLIEVTGGKAQLVSNGTAVDSNTKGLWHLDEASGNFVDYSGNSNTLTVTGTPTYNVTGQFGSDAVTFSGSGQYGQITDAAQTGLDITGSLTLEAWVNKTAFGGTDIIMEKWTSAANRSYQLTNSAAGALTFNLQNGGSSGTVSTAAGAITVGTWYHVAAVYDGATMKIYVNGTQAASTAYVAGIQNGGAPFEISTTGTAAFNGTIDEVRVSNTARYSANFSVATTPFGLYYSTTEPTINPTSSITGGSAWISFTEAGTLGANTALNYQLSSDDGTTWYYWTGAAWAVAGSTNYNSATVVNTNISSFPTTSGQVMFKAFLISDGSDQVQLDTITVRYQESALAGYATSGLLTSSAFDMGSTAAVQVIAWDETIPSCTPTCSLKFELRTAPDLAGAPDTANWTNWYGATGAGTFFTNHYGTRVDTDLNGKQWVQYRVTLTGDGVSTPALNDVTVNYH